MRTLVLVSMILLSAGVSLASSPTTDSAALLAQAAAQIKMCTFGESVDKNLSDAHEELVNIVERAKSDSALEKKLTLSLLLKTGRYKLEEAKEINSFHGRKTLLVNFSPRPTRERPKLGRGEDRYVDRAINELTGSVYIDEETGRLISLEGNLPQSFTMIGFWKKFVPGPLTMAEIKLEIKPDTELAWKPSQVELHFDGYGPRQWGRRHEKHTVPFSCAD